MQSQVLYMVGGVLGVLAVGGGAYLLRRGRGSTPESLPDPLPVPRPGSPRPQKFSETTAADDEATLNGEGASLRETELDVATALGQEIALDPTGDVPVLIVDHAILPGMCFEHDHALDLAPEFFERHLLVMASAQEGPVVLVALKDPRAPVTLENLQEVGTLFACSRWTNLPDSEGQRLLGYALEPASIQTRLDDSGRIRATYTRRTWMAGVTAAHSRMLDLALELKVAPPQNPVMWLAAYAMRGGLLKGWDGLQATVAGGPEAAVAAAESLVQARGADEPEPFPSPQLISVYEAHVVAVLARQRAFAQAAEGAWAIDLDTAELTVGPKTYALHLVGTTDPSGSEWLWSWADQDVSMPEPVTMAAMRLKANAIPEFQRPAFAIDETLRELLFIAQGGLYRSPYFYGTTPEAAGVQCLVDIPLEIGSAAMLEAVTRLPHMTPPVKNHGAAVLSGANALGLMARRTDDEITVQTADGRVVVTLDASHRVISAETLLR